MSDINTRIWFTQKARINSEIRFQRYNTVLNWLVISYSFALISVSIFSSSAEETIVSNHLQLILSIAIFTLSCVLFGANFNGRALEHRECYLRLGKLQDSPKTDVEKCEDYHELLAGYQNHRYRDYLKFVIDQKNDKKVAVKNSKGEEITLTKFANFKYFAVSFFYYLGVAILFLPPILVVLKIISTEFLK